MRCGVDWMVGGGGFRRVWEGFGEIEICDGGGWMGRHRARARETCPGFSYAAGRGLVVIGEEEGGVVADRLTG